MLPDLRRGFEAIERQRLALAETASALDAARLDWKPGPQAWGVRQVIEHLVLSDETIGRTVRAGEPVPDPLRRVPRAWRLALILGAFRRDLTLPLPSPDVEPRADAPLPALLERWASARASMARDLEDSDGRADAYAHPILGPLTAPEMLVLGRTHTAYHARQIGRIGREASKTDDRGLEK